MIVLLGCSVLFSIVIILLGEERADLYLSRAFVCYIVSVTEEQLRRVFDDN